MPFRFVSKDKPAKISKLCQILAEFLINNNQFINGTFTLLDRRPNPTDKIVERIRVLPEFMNLKSHPNFPFFEKIMHMFYKTSQKSLDKNRGCLLEVLTRTMKPSIRVSSYKMIPESLVYYNSTKLSDKDLDVVLHYEQIELFECKASLYNFLRNDPLPKKNKEKLALMSNINSLAASHSIVCYPYLVTYALNDSLLKHKLSNAGFNSLIILSRQEIMKRLSA